MAEPTPFIRPYDSSRDFQHGMHVFLSTISPLLDHEPTRTIGAHLWYLPYVSVSPSTCFVLDDGTGCAVGYIIGCASTLSFSQRWRSSFAPTVDASVVPPPDAHTASPAMQTDDVKHFRHAVYNAECSMLLPFPEELAKYPAHIHIDLLEGYRRKGWGTVLMQAFFEKAKEEGACGVHLDMVEENVGARRFYESLGFSVCQRVLDGGVSGRVGVNGVVVTLVREV